MEGGLGGLSACVVDSDIFSFFSLFLAQACFVSFYLLSTDLYIHSDSRDVCGDHSSQEAWEWDS